MEIEASAESGGYQQTLKLIDSIMGEISRHGGPIMGEISRHGGPQQYLEQCCAAAEFLTWLQETFPEAADLHYSHTKDLPKISEKELPDTPPLAVHVSALGFAKVCSLKPPCGLDLFGSLAESIFKDGFTTAVDPVMVLQNHEPGKELMDLPGLDGGAGLVPFSLGYLKGYSRCTSLLAILHFLMRSKADVKTSYPLLWESVCRVRVHVIGTASRVDEALQNMKLSCHGSLRKATNTIQCVFMVRSLMTFGLTDTMTFVRQWGAMSARQFQIVGKRAQTLKLLFDNAPAATTSAFGRSALN